MFYPLNSFVMKKVDFNQVYFHDCVRLFLDAVSEKFAVASVYTSLEHPDNVHVLMQYVPFTLKRYLDACCLYGMVFTCTGNPCDMSAYSYIEVLLSLDTNKCNF